MEERHLNRARRFLQRRGITPQDLAGFSFMKRYTPVTERHSDENKYGPGLLTLHRKDGEDLVLTLHARHHPSSVVRYLIKEGVSFDNLHTPAGQVILPDAATTYRRPSLYLFWHTILCLLAFCLGFYQAGIRGGTDGVIISLPLFALAVYWAYVLQTRFCYLSLDDKGLHVHSMGRVVTYPYEKLLKINFDFAREQQFTHVMEVLEKDCRYHLYYIGRVPRTQLPDICQRLRRTGIDATCSLNPEKRYYGDVYHRY